MKGKGCATCNKTGYKGRTGLYEVMEINDEIRELILVGASALELKKKAIEHGMITLRRSGLMKVAQGWTTLEEVARETMSLGRRTSTGRGKKENYGTLTQRPAPPHAGDEWQRSSHHHQLSAANPRARAPAAARPAAADARRRPSNWPTA